MKMIKHIYSIMLSLLLTSSMYAQDQVISVDQIQITPGHITDRNITQPLQKDWNTRNPKIQNQDVQWYQTGDWYYGTYSYNNQNYMTLYDPDGKYVETLKKSNWNSSTPNPVRSSFNLSTYRTQEVIEYWEVVDPGKKGYYVELLDSEGRTSRLWVTEKGDFSATPPR